MYIHLKERKYYEDTYDRHTIEDAHRGIKHYWDFYKEIEAGLPKGDTINRYGNVLLLNMFYMQVVGNDLLYRHENREGRIQEWMSRDEAKDLQISNSRLVSEPACQHCKKTGLRIIDKSLMHRGDNYKYDDPEEVLFMLRCTHCQKSSAYWEDGSEWERVRTYCPECKTEMKHKSVNDKKKVTTKYSCPNCKHAYDDVLDLTSSDKQEPEDADFEKDRAEFCLHNNEEMLKRLRDTKTGIENLASLGKEFKEKEDNKQIYDAVKELKKPKIAELTTLLSPALEKAGYSEFSLDKPEMGRDVTVGFNCLDTKSKRDDYTSQKELKKVITKALQETTWRLMSDGIHYRLGYLNGRLHAYETEEDMIKLVEKDKKLKYKKLDDITETDIEWNSKNIRTSDGRVIKF